MVMGTALPAPLSLPPPAKRPSAAAVMSRTARIIFIVFFIKNPLAYFQSLQEALYRTPVKRRKQKNYA
jgi:hypothetical protein